MKPNTPVIAEWVTAFVPLQRVTVVVRYSVAQMWIMKGCKLSVKVIDPLLMPHAEVIAISKVEQ
jgi:hypothetical protein